MKRLHKPHVHGPNPYSYYGSYGPSGTPAYGKVPDTYTLGYELTYTERYLPSDNEFYGNVILGGQKRKYYERTYTYWRIKYGRYGNEVSRVKMNSETFIDFDAWGALTGIKQKDRFKAPTGFGALATGWADFAENTAITIGTSISGDDDDNYNPDSSFFAVHPLSADPTEIAKEISEYEQYEDSRVKANLAINNALREYRNSIPGATHSTPLTTIPSNDDTSDKPIVVGPSNAEALQVEQLVFASSTDVIAYDPNLMHDISAVYKIIAESEGGVALSIISQRNNTYLRINDVVTADYIMDFVKDAINIPDGTYRLVDINIIDVKDVDEFGNQFNDPEMIITSMPALNASMIFSRVSED